MRNISCKHTVPQIEAGTKTETRRLGWKNVQRVDLLQTIVKGQGLKKGETVQKLRVIRVTYTHREPLRRLTDDLDYGRQCVAREGFPSMMPEEFVDFFCRTHTGCTPDTEVTVIGFEYVADDYYTVQAECVHCGENKLVTPEEGVCEECLEEDYFWCEVCRKHVCTDDRPACRHLYWRNGSGDWNGTGAANLTFAHYKAGLCAVLDKATKEEDGKPAFADALRRMLVEHNYCMGFYGSILGPEGVDILHHGMNYGSLLTQDLTDKEEEAMSDGVGWLFSLEAGKTNEWDDETVKWIDEWQQANQERAKL